MVFTCCSIASSNFISVARLDISRKAAVKERADCIDRLYSCIQNSWLSSYKLYRYIYIYICMLVVYGRSHATASLVHRLTMYRTIVCRYNPDLYY